MYATSKLIIPPKPARNSPFIPKLRIRLRHSSDQETTSGEVEKPCDQLCDDMSTVNAHYCSVDAVQHNQSAPLQHYHESGVPNTASKLPKNSNENASGCGVRKPVKRKMSPPRECDSDDSEPFFSKANLKALINRETFLSFPVDVQIVLSKLLPVYDYTKQTPVPCVSSAKSDSDLPTSDSKVTDDIHEVWLHPTALNNEFFTKSLQDYSDRHAKGEFTSRIRNRAGLRSHVGHRYRYPSITDTVHQGASKTENAQFAADFKDDSSASYQSHTPRRHSTRTKSKSSRVQSSEHSSTTTTSTVTVTTITTTAQSESLYTGDELKSHSKSPLSDKTHVYMKNKRRISCQSKLSDILNNPGVSSNDTRELKESVNQEKYSSSPTEFVKQLPNDSISDCKVSESHSTQSTPPVSVADCNPSTLLHSAKISTSIDIKTTALDSKVQDSSNTKFVHTRQHSLSSKFSESPNIKHNNMRNSSTVPLTPRSTTTATTPIEDNVSKIPSMPPPRQTKTLAAMREKLRAKRLLKESERSLSGHCYYSVPGSMTPHPTSGATGYYQSNIQSPSDNFSHLSDHSPNNILSPRLSSERSPLPTDKCNHSVNLSTLLNDINEPVTSTIVSSPFSPHSASGTDIISSPILHFTSTANESDNSSQATYSSTPSHVTQSNPSSPHLAICQASFDHQSSLLYTSTASSTTMNSPTSIHHQVHSSSAPSTPLMFQSGQNTINSSNSSGIVPTLLVSTSVSSVLQTSPVKYSPSSSSTPTNSNITQAVSSSQLLSQLAQTLTYPFSTESLSSINSTPNAVSAVSFSPEIMTSSVNLVSKNSDLNKNPSISNVTKLFTPGARQGRSSTTTRAFFVDGENLSEAVAFLQSLNPKATITQQQFFLIPSANKSQMFLYRAPVTSSDVNSSAQRPIFSNQTVSLSKSQMNPTVIAVSNELSGGKLRQPSSTSTPSAILSFDKSNHNYSGADMKCTRNISINHADDPCSIPCVTTGSLEFQSRSLIYSKSVNMSAPNNVPRPLSLLKSKLPKKSVDHAIIQQSNRCDQALPKLPINATPNMISSVQTSHNYKTAPSSSQLNISLLASGPAINSEIPILLVQDRNQNRLRPQTPVRPVNVNLLQSNSFDQTNNISERAQVRLPILPTATVITTHSEIINSPPGFMHPLSRPALSVQLSTSGSIDAQLGFQSISSYRPHIAATNSVVSSTFLSVPAATIMSPCLPAVILSHPLNIQSTCTTSYQQNIFTRSLP